MFEGNIEINESAINKVIQFMEEDNDPNLKLRIFITGGGCAGFSYGFTFDDNIADDDVVIDKGQVKVLIDAMSYQYLDGSVVDYESGLQGSRFTINNPNATTTCGCGSSFSI